MPTSVRRQPKDQSILHAMFEFNVISGAHIKHVLNRDLAACIPCIADAYLAHHDGASVNPDSYFLRFPDNPRNRIIALPASLKANTNVAGIKWIASFPGNVEKQIPRASAVLVLNDQQTGYPFALLEAAQISAARTAASAVLGARWLNGQQRHASSISFIGAGVIARHILDMFIADGWVFDALVVHDTDPGSANNLAAHATQHQIRSVKADATLPQALETQIVVFATNAGTPYVLPPQQFSAEQIVLNISLRDIAPELILAADNYFDDVDHCMKADTSPHLAEKMAGNRDFATGTLAQLMRGEVQINANKPKIFSPFGMGILDLALGKQIHDVALSSGLTLAVPNFFAETTRW